MVGFAVVAASVLAHDTGSPPHYGYGGPELATACEDFEVDTDGTLEAVYRQTIVVTGQTPNYQNGRVNHINAEIELSDKIQFASGSLSRNDNGGFDDYCSDFTTSVSGFVVTLSANCDDDPDDDTDATAESIDIARQLKNNGGDLEWVTNTIP